MRDHLLSDDQLQELVRLQSYYPYRYVFGVVRKDTGVFEAWCKPTRHAMHRLARDGHTVVQLTRGVAS